MAGFGTYFGLNIGVNALQTAQEALSVIGNNISNASTPGYTEETTNLTEANPFPPMPSSAAPIVAGQVGQGSIVGSVTRQVSPYYNKIVRDNLTNYNGQNTYLDNLNQIQGILGEPTSTSIHNALDNFYAAWNTVSTQPDSTAARQTVIEQARNLGNTFTTVQNQLTTVVDNLDSSINDPNSGGLKQVNDYASQINTLNQQIKTVTVTGQNPNQLLDQRDVILNNLAQLGNVSYAENKDGTVDVNFGSVSVVNSSTNTTTAFTNADVSGLTSGSIWANQQGIQEAQSVIGQLGTLQGAIVKSVNDQLALGFQYNNSTAGAPLLTTNTNTHTSASGTTTTSVITMSVVSGFTPDQLGVSSTQNTTGDGTNALTIAGFQNKTNMTDGTTTLGATTDDYYTSIVGTVGSQTASVQASQQTANSLLKQAQTLQQSVSGVNQNDEMAKMIDFQNMYQAASKFISIQDQMLQTLIQEV